MKSYLILIPIFILALLQGTVLPINLVLLVVLVWVAVRPSQEVLVIAFFSGLFLDLAGGTPLGLSSLALLLAAQSLLLYSYRFGPTHPLFLSFFIFLVSLIFNLIFKEPWLKEGLILVLLSFLAGPLIRFYQEDISQKRLKLGVE